MNSGSRSSLRTGKYLAKKRFTLLDVEVFHSRAFFALIRSKIEHVVKFDLVSSTDQWSPSLVTYANLREDPTWTSCSQTLQCNGHNENSTTFRNYESRDQVPFTIYIPIDLMRKRCQLINVDIDHKPVTDTYRWSLTYHNATSVSKCRRLPGYGKLIRETESCGV